MPNQEQADLDSKIQVLTKLGLTAMQARIYICLYSAGKAQAKTLSRLCNLPRQDVYKTLNELYETGLVEKALTKPIEFRGIASSKCISLLVERQKQRCKGMEQQAKKAFRTQTKNPEINEAPSSVQILMVPKKEPTLFRAKNMVNSATQSICVVSPHQNLFPWIHKESKAFENALKRGVIVRFITDAHNGTKGSNGSYRIFRSELSPEIRYLTYPSQVSFGICDHKKLILELSAHLGFLGSDVIITENPSLVDMATTYFEVMWSQADLPQQTRDLTRQR